MTAQQRPTVVLIGGPNGAGKSTCAPLLLQGTLRVDEFVNADTIARGLSAFRSGEVDFEAGRLLVRRIEGLAGSRSSFAFESTLASRSFAPWIAELRRKGFTFAVVYLWLRSPGLAQRRVAARVRLGGHHVPSETLHRRYARGLHNLFELYIPLADRWQIYDNSESDAPVEIAIGGAAVEATIHRDDTWARLLAAAGRPEKSRSTCSRRSTRRVSSRQR